MRQPRSHRLLQDAPPPRMTMIDRGATTIGPVSSRPMGRSNRSMATNEVDVVVSHLLSRLQFDDVYLLECCPVRTLGKHRIRDLPQSGRQ